MARGCGGPGLCFRRRRRDVLTARKSDGGKCKSCGGKGRIVKAGKERRCFACRGSGKASNGYQTK